VQYLGGRDSAAPPPLLGRLTYDVHFYLCYFCYLWCPWITYVTYH
jgi:hypothetical protein